MAKLPQLRKAKMKKNTKYQDGKRLSIDDEVMIQEIFLGRGRMSYTASKTELGKGIISFHVTPSMFEFTEKEKFVVYVARTVQACKEIIVEATNREEAYIKALEEAGNYDFGSGDNPEYETLNTALTVAEHKEMYPHSNLLK